MHPKITEFVSAMLAVAPSDVDWQMSFEKLSLSMYVRTPSERMEKSLTVSIDKILQSRKPEEFGRVFMFDILKGLDHAVQPRNKSEAPQSRSEGL